MHGDFPHALAPVRELRIGHGQKHVGDDKARLAVRVY
jgi:hypothetical protein